jgi:hypothetical protein
MPRNASGIYTLPDSNPVATGEVITSDWANETMTDIENEMSASLPRDGSAPMTGKLSLIDGLPTAPALRFTKDGQTGWYRKPDGTIGVTVKGQIGFEITATGAAIPTGKSLVITDVPKNPADAVNKAYVDSHVGKSILTVWTYIATLGQTVFTGNDINGNALNYNAPSTIFTMNGVVLQPVVDYVLTDANTISLTVGAQYAGDVLMAIEIAGSTGPRGPEGPQGEPGVAELEGPSLATFVYTATADQAIFTGADDNNFTLAFKEGDLLVFVNGEMTIEFSTPDTETVALTNPAAAGDQVVIVEVTRAAGIQGEAGPQGEVGPMGLTGPAGTQGAVGPKGDKGEQGLRGYTGNPGETGPAGPASTVPGPQGPAGPKGDTGSTGPAGPASTVPGPQGPKGDTGAASTVAGPQGIQGPKGDTGATGPAGAKGDTGAASTVPGPQGPAGATGPKGADGTSVNIIGTLPSPADLPATGEKGDAYTIAGNLWVWTGTEWVDAGPIQGPKGDTGAVGPQGPAGADGAVGAKGDTGAQGPAGADSTVAGPAGPAGPKGDTGADGAVGPQGPAGAAGADSTVAGPAGPAGAKGDTGATGPQGPAGADSTVAGPQGPKGDTGATGPAGPAADMTGYYTKAEVDAAITAALAAYLPLAGGTLSGPLRVTGAVTATADITAFAP